MEGAVALGDMNALVAESSLLFALSDPTPQVRTAAAAALGQLRSSASIKALASILLSVSNARPSQPEAVREAAAAALGQIGESAANQSLSQALRKDPSPTVRILAAESLGQLGDRSGIPVLISFLREEASGLRKMAAAALRRIGDASALEALSYLSAKDSNEDVREAATKAVEEIRARE